MSALSFYQGLPDAWSTSTTSFVFALPAPLQAGDAVFISVTYSGSLTVPSGWTLVNIADYNSGTVNRLTAVYRKNTVTSSDSNTSVTFTKSPAGLMGGHVFAVRATGSVIDVLESATSVVNNVVTFSITPPTLTATKTSELFIGCLGSANGTSFSTIGPIPTGSTLMSVMPNSVTHYGYGVYQARTAGQSNSGVWSLTTTTPTSLNGLGVVMIRLGASLAPDTITDSTSIEDSGPSAQWTINTAQTDSVYVSSESLMGRALLDALADVLSVQPNAQLGWPVYAADAISVQDPTLARRAAPAAIVDTASASDALIIVRRAILALQDAPALSVSTHTSAVKSMVDGLAAGDALSPSTKTATGVSDTIRVAAQLLAGWAKSVSDTVSTGDILAAVRGITVLEELGLAEFVLARAKNGLSLSDQVNLVDVVRRFFGGEATDAVRLGSSASPHLFRFGALADSLGVAGSLSARLVLRVVTSDDVEIDDAALLRALFKPQLVDGVDLSAAFLSPSGGLVTWAVNAVSGSVSQYDNYAFNSFAKFGQMFIGADETGLYELSGADDDGDAIVARVKSGLAQLTASRFTMIRDAYIGMRGDGCFILRVTTGEGDVYDYAFDAQNMRTTRVPLGKGMRTRYMSFELIGDGADFDLESVEFIPIMSQRRV